MGHVYSPSEIEWQLRLSLLRLRSTGPLQPLRRIDLSQSTEKHKNREQFQLKRYGEIKVQVLSDGVLAGGKRLRSES